jgi:hypothetical protein
VVRFSLEQSSFSAPSLENPDEPQKIKNPLEEVAPSSRPITFSKTGKTWKSDESEGFRAAVLARQLTPVLDDLLIENAVYPRPLWFASNRRLKIGDELDVAGESLPMIVAGKAKGSCHLKLESIEPVNGHPCGVFSVTGDISRTGFPDFEGNLTDEDISIQSGKLWLSLLYPVILRAELDTIQTSKSGGQGNLSGHGQGAVKVSITRDWKPVAP